MFFILGAWFSYYLMPQPSPKKKKVYKLREYSLFDATFAIRSQYFIPRDSSIENPNPQKFEKLSIATYVDENINLAVSCQKYKKDQPLDTGYEKMVRLYLYSTDREASETSLIKARKTLVIDDKRFVSFSGERTSDQPLSTKDYFYDKFDIMLQESPPYTYMLYLGYNLNGAEIDSIKERMYRSIRITKKN